MINFKSGFITMLALFYLNVLMAQKYYEPGYVVLLNNDTVYGKVKDRTPEPFGELFEKIRFRDEGLFKKTYGPRDLKAYQIGDRQYESHFVEAQAALDIAFFEMFKGSGSQIFLKVRQKGALSYYHEEWRDPDSGYYDWHAYFKKASDSRFEFIRITLFGYNKKKMRAYLKDCPYLVKLLDDGGDPSLIDIVTLYNSKCAD